MKFTCAILVVSDTCFNKDATDETGPALAEAIKRNFPEATGPVSCTLVPDDQDQITASLKCLCKHDINLILTTGGTGLQVNDMEMLSRAVVGHKDNSLIVNLPDSLERALECFEFIKSIIPHSIDTILNRTEGVQSEVNSKKKSILKIDEKGNEISKVKFIPAPMKSKPSRCAKVSFDAALEVIRDHLKCEQDVEDIAIEHTLNRVLANDIKLNPLDKCPFRRSISNGYAVIAADLKCQRILKPGFTDHDDQSNFILLPGECVRVSVGTCIPKGADSVIPLEDTTIDIKEDEIKIIPKTVPICEANVEYDWAVFPDGVIFKNKEIITSTHIGLFAALGYSKVQVYKRPRIGILSTGDANHIKNCNNFSLLNFLKHFGYDANDLGCEKHHPDLLKQALYKAFTHHDVIITTGGVSVSEYEVMQDVLIIDFGATIVFGRVNMEPGNLTIFATCSFNGSTKFIFSLSGDFASVLVSSRLLVIPALRTYEHITDNIFNTLEAKVVAHYPGRRFTAPIPMFQTGEIRNFRRVSLKQTTHDGSAIYAVDKDTDNIRNCFSTSTAALLIIPEKTNLKYDEYIHLKAIMLYSH